MPLSLSPVQCLDSKKGSIDERLCIDTQTVSRDARAGGTPRYSVDKGSTLCIYICPYIYMYTHVCINIYNCTYIYVYIYIYTCIYAYIYEYIYEYTCIHINIHTYSQSCPLRNTTIKKHILTFRANAGLFCKAYVYVVIYCVSS